LSPVDVDKLRGAIIERVAALGPDDLQVLDAITRELPAETLRAACEQATARGWCATGEERVVVPMTPADGMRRSFLALVRQVSRLVIGREHPARRERVAVLADERERRTTPGLAKGGAK
jgi:hypothetical protein